MEASSEEPPLLALLLAESEPTWDRPKTVANLPYGYCEDRSQPGLFPVGDQFAVLPSFTGTGVSFAMASGVAAARAILRSPGPEAASRYFRDGQRMARPVLRRALPLHRLLQDPGFVRLGMHLVDWVPSLISALPPVFSALLDSLAVDRGDIRHWAVHPGGPAILDQAKAALGIDEGAVATARQLLAEHGNMSSATIWFLLDRIRRQAQTGLVYACGFGPGLTLESAVLSHRGVG